MTPPKFQNDPRLRPANRAVKTILLLFSLSILLAACGSDPKGLVEDYLSDNPDTSGRAERELLELGEEAIPALIDAFVSAQNREKVGRLLARLGRAAAGPLIGLLEGENAGMAADAANVLVGMGPNAVEPLIEAIESPTTRSADLSATLGRIGGPAWVPMLELFDSTEDVNLKGIFAATFFASGDPELAPLLLPRINDPEVGDALLSAVVAHTPPDKLAMEIDAETIWRILCFIPLEPLVGQVSELVRQFSKETVKELKAMAHSRRDESPFDYNLVRMHLSGLAGKWSEAASFGAEPFELLVVSYDLERDDPEKADLIRVALLHHGGLYLKYLIDGAEALEPEERGLSHQLALLAGEVTQVIEELVNASGY